MAAERGHTDTVKELLSSGATVDQCNQVGAWKCVPLTCSVVYSSCMVVPLLITEGNVYSCTSCIMPYFYLDLVFNLY